MTSREACDRAAVADPAGEESAHELKNLLAVVLGVCESLAETSVGARAELARVGAVAAEKAGGIVGRIDGTQRLPERAPSPTSPAATGAGRTVLVVEDDPSLLKLMSAAFERAGFRTFSARNGRLGVQLVAALKPDLMVTDIVMPEKDGIATIIEAKALAPATAVIAISGGGVYGRSGKFLQWAEELGADRTMAKPFAMSQLLSAARSILDRGGAPDGARAATG